MKFFITGLCLQGNKGGPALALSLMKVLLAEIPDAEFVFSVPPEPEFQHEKRWAQIYGVTVVEDNWDGGLPSLHPWRVLKEGLGSSLRRFRRLRTWHQAMRSCDVVLDMTAIGYVGPPEGSEFHGLGMRYRYFKAAQRTGRVFRAWTQSYGPFSTPALVKAAKEDLSTLPTVYCRGEESLRQVQAFLPGKDCRAYPDVAVVLDYDRQRGHELIKKAFGQTPDRRIVTISSSAVQFSKAQSATEALYVERRARLVENLLDRGYAVLFVPHTLRPSMHSPFLCDLAVAMAIHAKVRPSPWVSMIYADLSAADLKSVISCADVHVGARYHSVVAALSAGVPAISLSWHHKYADIMSVYEQSKFVLDGQSQTLAEDCTTMVDELMARRNEVSARLVALQPQVAAAVYENARNLALDLRGIFPSTSQNEHITMTDGQVVSCRVCGSKKTKHLATIEFHQGYPASITECSSCGCRFSPHDNSVYEIFHSQPHSSYARYRELAEECLSKFKDHDLRGLLAILSQNPKYKMIIDKLSILPKEAKILEIGCARGFLSSYFILDGRDIIGVDVSADAVSAACADFGNRFYVTGDPRIEARAPYDAVFHVGTIGCVDNPTEMIRSLLGLLRPGGLLVFNAPNVDTCVLTDQAWFSTATPPDLVTLFKPGVWQRLFHDVAVIEEFAGTCDEDTSLRLNVARLLRRKWRPPSPIAIEASEKGILVPLTATERGLRMFERILCHIFQITGASKLLPEQPGEYNLFVTMRKK